MMIMANRDKDRVITKKPGIYFVYDERSKGHTGEKLDIITIHIYFNIIRIVRAYSDQ